MLPAISYRKGDRVAYSYEMAVFMSHDQTSEGYSWIWIIGESMPYCVHTASLSRPMSEPLCDSVWFNLFKKAIKV